MTGFDSKRTAAKAKLDDDDVQGYIAEYEEALLISYQSGFADGKAAQRPWVGLTDEDWAAIGDMPDSFDQGVAWAAARLKERNT